MNEREIRVLYMDDCGINQFVFKQSVIDEVIEFILDSFDKLNDVTYCLKKDVIVCLPRYIVEEMERMCLGVISVDSHQPYLSGIKCQISYENSVTVFYNDYIPNKIIKYTKEL